MDFPHAVRDVLKLNDTVVIGQDGQEHNGILNPDGNSVKEKIGFSLAEIKGFPGRNKVSGEATGDNTHLRDATGTRFLGPEILGADANADQREDELICSAVEGCAAALLKLGREKGIIPTPVIPPAEVANAKTTMQATLAPAAPDLTDLVKYLDGEVRAIVQAANFGIPSKGGGVPAIRLRAAMQRLILIASTIRAEWPGIDR